MAGFENYTDHARKISEEIEAKLAMLDIDWRDEPALRAVAREALDLKGDLHKLDFIEDPLERRTHMELHGLIALMLQTMRESADVGYEVHGGDSWKALAKALWAEMESDGSVSRGTK